MTDETAEKTLVDRLLGVFSDVRRGEGSHAVLMLVSLFLLMVSYYVLKTVREPLILAGGSAEPKSYAAAAQAGVLMLFVPVYSALANRVDRPKLIAGTLVAFLACLQGFYFLGVSAAPSWLGVVYYIWVGIFSVAAIAQFWSLANDLYSKDQGERLFPIIGIGMTGGAAAGSYLSKVLFDTGLGPYTLMQVAAGLLLAHLILTMIANASWTSASDKSEAQKMDGANGFLLVLTRPYIRLIAILLILLNVVNTTGEYLLGQLVVDAALVATDGSEAAVGAWIGSFYGDFFFWVNIAAVSLQALFVSRLVKWFGITAVLFALPIVAIGVYGGLAAGASFVLYRWLKTAENSTDYSVMNTAKNMLWLPTSRDEKYKAKQAVDTFFVRLGDVISAGIVFVGTTYLALNTTQFALVNVFIIGLWLLVSWRLVIRYKALAEEKGLNAPEETA